MLLTGKLQSDLETVFDFFSKNEAASEKEEAEVEDAKQKAMALFALVGDWGEVIDLPPEHPLFSFENVRPQENDHPAFILLFEIARSLPMRGFVKDVTFHDRNNLRFAPRDRQFAWMIRPTGSTLFWRGDRVKLETIESASQDGAVYWWGGDEAPLKPVTAAQAKELLDRP